MEKKVYVKPQTEVEDVKMEQMLMAASAGPAIDNGGGEGPQQPIEGGDGIDLNSCDDNNFWTVSE